MDTQTEVARAKGGDAGGLQEKGHPRQGASHPEGVIVRVTEQLGLQGKPERKRHKGGEEKKLLALLPRFGKYPD